MVPYRGRFALRIARLVLAAVCLAAYVRFTGGHCTWIVALLAAYLVYSVGAMFEDRYDSIWSVNIGLIVDTAYFGFWTWLAPGGWNGSTPAGWMSAFDASYLFASTVLLQDVTRVVVVSIVALIDSLLFTPPEEMSLVWTALGMGTTSIALALYKRYVDRRMSNTLR